MPLLDVRYLILAVTSRCNLRCRYCYLAAESTGQDMSDRVLDRALDLADHNSPCHVQVTGGEPALRPDKLIRIGKRCRNMSRGPSLAIQTNGSLLTEELLQIFRTYDYQVGISLDGPPEIHDRQRGMADETLRGLKRLEEQGIPFRVTTVVTRENVGYLDRLALLLAGFSNSRGLGLDLLVAKGRAGDLAIQPPSATQLRQGMNRLTGALAMINRSRRQPLRLREQDLLAGTGRSPHFCRAASGQSLAVHPDGRLYPCGQTMGDPVFACGTVEQPEPLRRQPLTSIRLQQKDCSACHLNCCCPDDCPSRLYYNTENRELTCTLYQELDQFQNNAKRRP
ncbi:MAG: radical SAM protein [Deltaproteobacteria bacterium]|nr:radical SAM protein [Deltaproteobacteria bacterium]